MLAAARRIDGVDLRPLDSTFLSVPLFIAVLVAANLTPPGDADVVVNSDILLAPASCTPTADWTRSSGRWSTCR